MRFDQKLMNYVMGEITFKRLDNCRKVIEKQAEDFGGFTVLQVITLKSMLKTLRRRIVENEEFNPPLKEHLLYRFDYLFADIMGYELNKK